jgi:hypothetical protein
MLSTGVVHFAAQFVYLLVLSSGVLGICYWRSWPLVNYLSFVCAYALVFDALQSYDASHFWDMMPPVTGLFILFSTMTFLYQIVNASKSNLLDILALLANAGVYYALSHHLITEAYRREWVAAVTLGLSAFYTGHVWYFLLRRIVDRELLVSFTGLAAFFLAVTIAPRELRALCDRAVSVWRNRPARAVPGGALVRGAASGPVLRRADRATGDLRRARRIAWGRVRAASATGPG